MRRSSTKTAISTGRGSASRKKDAIAKISAPAYSDVLLRRRLFALLDKAGKRPIVWVCGPPGAGKTTLITSYLKHREFPCLWYQVDEGDGDIASFFYYMGLAAKKAGPRRSKPMPLLTPEYLQSVPIFTRRYFEELFRRLTPPRSSSLTKRGKEEVVLIFDNYQDAPADADFHEMLCEGLETIPDGVKVIVMSRSEAPRQFARLRANDKMSLIGWNELSFTHQECRAFLKKKATRAFSEKAVKQIHDRTEGWAAGLVLMTEAARTSDMHYSLLSELSREAVFDYFANEILEKADEKTRDFLLRTSFFSSVTVKGAEALTGNTEARSLLTMLSRNHYFTEWRPLPASTYQYHPLFKEFLRARAAGLYGLEELNEIKRSTAAILEGEGRTEDAAHLLIDAGDWHGLTGIILGHAQTLITQGRHKSLEGWLRALPEQVIDANPWLIYWLGVCRTAFDPRESRGLLERSFSLFRERQDAPGIFLSWAGIVDMFFYVWGDFSPLDHWISVMEEILVHFPFPSAEIEMRIAGSMLWAMANSQPRRRDLAKWVERSHHIVVAEETPFKVTLAGQLLAYYIYVGDFSKAALVIEALRQSGESRDNELARQIWYSCKALYALFVADLAGCKGAISEGLKIGEESGVRLRDVYLLSHGSLAGVSLGHPDFAVSCLGKMALVNSPWPGDKALYHYEAASVAWYYGDYQKAAEHGNVAIELCKKINWPVPTGLCIINQAVTFFDAGRHDEADKCLAEAIEISRGMNGLSFIAGVHGARFAMDRGMEREAVAFLRRAMELGARYGYLNMPRWNNVTMSRLCAKALELGIEREYVRVLIRKRNLLPPIADSPSLDGKESADLEKWPYPLRLYTLGTFKILKDDRPVEFSGKVQQRPLSMLKALIALGGRGIPKTRMCDILWPDAAGDSVNKSFDMALQRLRRLLGIDAAVQLRGGIVSIDPRYCWVDAWALEDICGKIKDRFEAGPAERAMALYNGDFLETDMEQPWAASMREKMRSRLIQLSISLGRHWERKIQWDRAIECYEKGISADALAEELYLGLMICHEKLGQRAEAMRVYQRCSSALASALDISPSEKIRAIHSRIRSKK